MDAGDLRGRLEERLSGLDWGPGVTKEALAERLADDEPLGTLVGLYVPEGTYFSAADVLTVIPTQAWQDAQGDDWRGGELPDAAATQSAFRDSPVAQPQAATGSGGGATEGSEAAPQDATQSGGLGAAVGGATAQVRQSVGQAAQAVGQTAAKVAEQARERAGAAAHGVASVAQGAAGAAHLTDLTDRVRQTASQARDQVVSIRPRGAEAALPAAATPAPTPAESGPTATGPARRLVPVALSAIAEGLGQAYNRQPRKAVGFFALGMTLSTVSGLNTWLARRLFRAENARIGPDRVQPFLLGLWSTTYGLNLWDAWRHASAGAAQAAPATGAEATPPTTWSDLDQARPTASPAAEAGTDQFPTVGPA